MIIALFIQQYTEHLAHKSSYECVGYTGDQRFLPLVFSRAQSHLHILPQRHHASFQSTEIVCQQSVPVTGAFPPHSSTFSEARSRAGATTVKTDMVLYFLQKSSFPQPQFLICRVGQVCLFGGGCLRCGKSMLYTKGHF